MALIWDASLTDAGVSMISQWAQGTGNKLTITGAVIGEGVVAATQLHSLTQLTDQKSTISIQGSELVANGVKLKLRKTSQGITTSFILNQIGIYAKLDTSGGTPIIADSLIAVYQQDTGVLVPTEADSPDFVFTFYATVQTNYQGDLTINVDTSAILSQDDIADNLVTADATMALSANMGHAIGENLAAIEQNGAKNQLDDSNCTLNNMTQSGHTFTSNATDTRYFFDFAILAYDGTTYLTVLGDAHISVPNTYEFEITIPNNANRLNIKHNGEQTDIGIFVNINVTGTWVLSIDITGVDPTTVGGLSFENIMIRDARIIDPTFVPFAETNLQLTQNKAERADIATINITGSTNTTGATIPKGTLFYLNGSLCRAIAYIGNGDIFTLNDNFKVANIGSELYGESGTFTLTPIGGTYTDGFTSQTNNYVRVGGLCLIYGTLELAGNPDSSHTYVECSGVPFSTNSWGEAGFGRIANNSRVTSGVRQDGAGGITVYFDLADGTFPTAGQIYQYTLIYRVF